MRLAGLIFPPEPDRSKVDRAVQSQSYPQAALFRALDTRRAAMGASFAQWSAAARVSVSTINRIKRDAHAARPATLAQLRKGLDRVDAGRGAAAGVLPREAIKAIFSGFLLAACQCLDVPVGLAQAIDPTDAKRGATADSVTRRAHQARAVALYLANVQAGISQSQLAGMLGIDKAAISRGLSRLEDARDEASFDQIVQRAARLMDEGEVW